MNRKDAKVIAEKITNEQLNLMFKNAKIGIKDWKEVSCVNKGMTKGTAWNILASDFNIDHTYHLLAKTNMIREFGDFLPDELKVKKNIKQNTKKEPIHQTPKFK